MGDEEGMGKLGRAFLSTLIGDVAAAHTNLDGADQAARRNLVRTTFAAIEGAVWTCREHVRQAAKDMGHLTPLADLALREQNYTVSEQGELIEQVRYITLPASIRLTVKQAQMLSDAVQVEFNGPAWPKLKAAIAIRNRITHPKQRGDLIIEDAELTLVHNSFLWVLATTTEVMAAINAAFAIFSHNTKIFVDALKNGDPTALALYERELMRPDEK